jgi:predicted  nucleic acid-binding Zn-ribbon protein
VKRPGPRVSAAQRAAAKQARYENRRRYLNAAGAAAAGTAVAAGAAAGVAAADTAQQQLDMLSSRLAALQDAAALVDVYEELEETDSELYALPSDIAAIRDQGYVFANYLERKAQVLGEQWEAKREEVVQAVEQRSVELQREIDQAENILNQAYSGGQSRISRAENTIQQLESRVAAAQDAIENMFKTIDENVTQLMSQLDAIEWTMDQAAEASFDFYEGEDFVAACEAQLIENDKEGPKGVLHLTNERLVFEQKEEVATKKVLFITTEKEKVQQMVFEEMVGYVEEIKSTQAGFLGHKEMMEIDFAPDARYTKVALRLIGADNEAWTRLINRVKTGDIDRERVRAAEDAAAEEQLTVQVDEPPTKCPNCGALFTAPIVRGMREISCDYCGTVVRL